MEAARGKSGEAGPERVDARGWTPIAVAFGVVAALAAAAALWASEGASVFLTQAFAALAACF